MRLAGQAAAASMVGLLSRGIDGFEEFRNLVHASRLRGMQKVSLPSNGRQPRAVGGITTQRPEDDQRSEAGKEGDMGSEAENGCRRLNGIEIIRSGVDVAREVED